MLLIDYLEESAAYLRERWDALRKLENQYRHAYDPDLKLEANRIRQQIRKKEGEITMELLLNLEEFRALHKYFPELLGAYMEDEYVGRALSKKSWLVDFKNTPPQQALAKLQQLKASRASLRDAKKFLRKWIGKVQARSLVATYPVLKGHMTADMDKDEALELIKKVDRTLLREGWLVLITDTLIQMPLTKFMAMINHLSYEEVKAKAEHQKATGRGTVAEAAATKKLREISRDREHYERLVTQILLANPAYLKSLKKKKNWLSREKGSTLERFAQNITPHSLKERAWLNEMKKRLEK
ncbi:MAG: hypothetical protein PHF60_00190 [Candidatus ainarchaeum sp.]|nr:hypothetical protein [Candidatus ainarchaeum sp.]